MKFHQDILGSLFCSLHKFLLGIHCKNLRQKLQYIQAGKRRTLMILLERRFLQGMGYIQQILSEQMFQQDNSSK